MEAVDPKVPHFFKVMLNEDIQTGKLIIPKKFVRKYGTNLCKSNVVLLKIPTGDTWKVELMASDGVVQLEKGWPEFLNFYSIEHGDFLMFRYESRSSNELDVVVCNETCTEVEYPKKPRVNISPIKEEDIGEDDVIAEETRERQPSRRVTRRTTPLRIGTVPPRRTTRSTAQRLDDPTERTSRGESDTLERKKGKGPSSSQDQETRGTLKGAERAKALGRAKSFKSSKPHFLVVMQPRYVRPPYYLNVPGIFAKRFMGQEGRGEMKLHVSGDKIWTTGYKFKAERGRTEARVVRGWKTFVEDNDLILGDVCAFELIKGLRSISFKITIFRAPRLLSFHSSWSQGSGGGAAPSELEGCWGAKSLMKEGVSSFGTKQAGKNSHKITRGFGLQPFFVPDYPSFQVVATKSNLSHGMNIPIGFMRDHVSLECKEWIATLMLGSGSWLVKLIVICSSKPKAFLSGGFCAFRKENSLEAGDTCSFELIQRAEMVFRVSIIRRAKKAAEGLTEVDCFEDLG